MFIFTPLVLHKQFIFYIYDILNKAKGGVYMKIKVELNDSAEDIEVYIRAHQQNSKVQALTHYIENFEKNKDFISFKTDRGLEFINQKDIIYMEITGKEISIITDEHTYQTTGRLYQMIALLDKSLFVQVSKSAVINMNKLVRLENYFSGSMLAFLKNKNKVAVTRNFLPQLKEHLNI